MRHRDDGKFSNSGIEEVYKKACSAKVNTPEEIITLIQKSKPNVTNDDLIKYEKSKKLLMRGDSYD
jgi:hypothetical protein